MGGSPMALTRRCTLEVTCAGPGPPEVLNDPVLEEAQLRIVDEGNVVDEAV